ncbi:unnamed protein product [Brassica napus]|uniref:(rape) hypothetical protein n=1 Tax=Brassica napus TaxID=3708 RepID=A0A816SAG7_BRANA|nr:unnamed protein product [Brassica napus]
MDYGAPLLYVGKTGHGFHVCGLSYIAAKNTVDAKGWSKKGITHQTITINGGKKRRADEFPFLHHRSDRRDVVGQIVNFGFLENKIIKRKDNMRLLIELRDPKFCSVKEWKGAYSISSGYNSTHILLNPTFEFIEEFKVRYVSSFLRSRPIEEFHTSRSFLICERHF